MPLTEKEEQYARECAILAPEAIEDEFARVSSDQAFWGAKYAAALEVFLVADEDADAIKGNLLVVERNSPDRLPGEKKPSIDDAKAVVAAHPQFRAARAKAIRAEVDKVRIKGILDSIESKREMLVSLGATIRQQREQDPVIRARLANDREIRRNNG